MQKLLLTIDKISTFVGHAFSWLIVALTLLISWEVFSRYALDHPHPWAFDAMIILYVIFFIPGVFALTYAGYYYAAESWAIWERSNVTAEGPPIYPFKTMLPLAGAFLLLQGIVEIIRCVICITQG